MTELTVIEELKAQADKLGIKYNGNIGEAKLQEKLDDHAEAVREARKEHMAVEDVKVSQRSQKADLKREMLRLVRVRVSCNNPHKKGVAGDVFAAYCKLTGTVKKYVPFNSPHGWHVPKMLIEEIKSKQYQGFIEKKTPDGKKVKRPVLLPSYVVEIMEPLTHKEVSKITESVRASSAAEDY